MNATTELKNASALTNTSTITAQKLTNTNTISGAGNLIVVDGGSSDAAITQSVIAFGGGTFVNNANITATTSLGNTAILQNNKAGVLINAQNILNSGTITGIGDLTIVDGGYNLGTIDQNNVVLTGGTLQNSGTLTAQNFTNSATVDGVGILNVTQSGVSNSSIVQSTINLTGTSFVNNDDMTATQLLNNGQNNTLDNNSNINVHNTTSNDALLDNKGIINNVSGSLIAADTITNTGTVNLNKSVVNVFYQSGDIAGVINVKGTSNADASDLAVIGKNLGTSAKLVGQINIGGSQASGEAAALNLYSGEITKQAVLNIEKGSVLNINGLATQSSSYFTSATVNADDKFAGDVRLIGGIFNLEDVSVSVGATSTTVGGELPYYEQSGGALSLVNSKIAMEDSSKISGGVIGIDSNSQFVSQSNGFKVWDLLSTGLVQAINDNYETYDIDLIGTTDLTGNSTDERADFTTDLYVRSNENKKHDTYGSTSTLIGGNLTTKKGEIHVSDWKIHGDLFGYDAPIDKNIKIDLFPGSVIDGYQINFSATDKEVFTPIGWYKLKGGGTSGSYTFGLDRYNPTVFRGQVSKIAQYQNQLAINDMLFNHTMLDQGFKDNDRMGNFAPNKYASSSDLFAPYQYSKKDGGLWVKSYGIFEKLNMNHGFSVGNNAYGTLIGADFGLEELRNGWSFMQTAYVGYNGAHQHWNGNATYQNGAQAGFLGTWYKDNLIIGALGYGGVYGTSMNTPRGDDHSFNFYGGLAGKTAYNWKFHKDFALQPNLLASYNYFGQENWHTDFGQMGMMSSPLHGVNVAPGVNLIWEKETFSTYLTLQYMYNLSQAAGGRAGNVNLPHVHMDRGFIQYGIGANKRFTDTFSGYAQAVVRNVGRTGVGFQLGANWKLGKNKPTK